MIKGVKMEKKLLSVIIPAYNEEALIEKAACSIGEILKSANISYEILFVDDGSKDKSWDIISSVSSKDTSVRGIHFSRNFGKEAAIMAGLTKSSGDGCVVIDCDLQHPPEKIVEMYCLWEQGYEIIEGKKSSRGTEGRLHTFAAKTFYSIISTATGIDMANASDFKLLDRKAVNVLINMQEKNAFFRALSSWIGFKTTSIEFDVQDREAGESKWTPLSLVKYAINNISSFSAAPMQFVTALGAIMLVVSVILGGIALFQKICGQALEGFTTVILIQLFSSSVVMISLGIIGYYIAKIYEEVKRRPQYIIADTCGGMAQERSV